jgi:hypothetical protein
MYDHDLRLWYRDLFLHSARRQRRRAALADLPLSADLARGKTLGPAGAGLAFPDADWSSDHERPQASH